MVDDQSRLSQQEAANDKAEQEEEHSDHMVETPGPVRKQKRNGDKTQEEERIEAAP